MGVEIDVTVIVIDVTSEYGDVNGIGQVPPALVVHDTDVEKFPPGATTSNLTVTTAPATGVAPRFTLKSGAAPGGLATLFALKEPDA